MTEGESRERRCVTCLPNPRVNGFGRVTVPAHDWLVFIL